MRLSMMKGMFAFSVCVALFASVTAAHAQNIVVNGDFEANVGLNGAGFVYKDSIPGWKRDTSKLPGQIEIQQENVAGTTPDGIQFLELDSDNPSYVYQDLSTIAGTDYTVTFIYSKRANVFDNGFKFRWNNDVVTFDLKGNTNPPPNPYWSTYTSTFKATGTSTRIAFQNYNPGDTLGAYIDAVSVSAVPEPGEVAAMSLFLGGIGFGILRRRVRGNAR